jgi:hypothetical protein
VVHRGAIRWDMSARVNSESANQRFSTEGGPTTRPTSSASAKVRNSAAAHDRDKRWL